MKLSRNLTLTEAIKSITAIRLDIDNEPTKEHLENLILVAERIFQPVRDHFNTPVYISSGYRSKALNKAVNGSKTSDHCKGKALDIDQDGKSYITNRQVFDYIKDNLEFKQLIWEHGNDKNPAWVHVSYDENDNKKEILRAIKINKKTKYISYG